MSDTIVASDVTAEATKPDNAAFARLRIEADAHKAQFEAERTARAELEKRLQDIERGRLDETERLRLEKADADKALAELTPLRDEHGRFQTALQKASEDALAALPDDVRVAVEPLVTHVPLTERLAAIQSVATPFLATVAAGTVTKPGSRTPADLIPSPDKLSWADAVEGHRRT